MVDNGHSRDFTKKLVEMDVNSTDILNKLGTKKFSHACLFFGHTRSNENRENNCQI